MRDEMKQTYAKGDQPLRVMPSQGWPAAELEAALDQKVPVYPPLWPVF